MRAAPCTHEGSTTIDRLPADCWAVVTSGDPAGRRGPARRDRHPAGLTAGRAPGMRTVALATTHERSELLADVVVTDLSAVSALATHGGVEITAAD